MSNMAARTPQQLAARSLVGSWVVLSVAPLTFLCIPFLKDLRTETGARLLAALLWRIPLLVSPAIAGFILITSKEKKLRLGLSEDRWPEARLAEARDWIARPTLRFVPVAFAVVLLAVSTFALLTQAHGPRGLATFTYIFMVPATTHLRLKTMLAPPAPPHMPLFDPSTLKPLRSDHWGQQP